MVLLGETLLSPWVVIPLAGATMLITAVHVLAVEVSGLDKLRKRLRIANGVMMMLIAAMLAYALGVAEVVLDPRLQPGSARAFVIVWLMIVGLLGIVVALAIADAIGTAAYGLGQRSALRREFREKLAGGEDGDGRGSAGASESVDRGESRRG